MGPVDRIMSSAKPHEEPDGDEGLDGKEAAAAAILEALKSKDASALASALSDFVSMCGYEE